MTTPITGYSVKYRIRTDTGGPPWSEPIDCETSREAAIDVTEYASLRMEAVEQAIDTMDAGQLLTFTDAAGRAALVAALD